RGVALARLDLRESSAAHARRARQVVERHPAGLAALPQVLRHAAPQLRGADVVAGAGGRANGLARHHLILHYTHSIVAIAKTSSPAKGGRSGAHAAGATLSRSLARDLARHLELEPAREVPAHGGTLVNRLVRADEAADLLLRAADLPRVHLDARTGADAE